MLSKGKRKMHSSVPSDIDPTLLDSDEVDSDLYVRKTYNTKLYTHDSKQALLSI